MAPAVFGLQGYHPYYVPDINTLPALEEKLTKKDQYGATVPNEEVVEYIDKRLQAGERFICKMPNGDGQTFVIMEEK